MKKDLCSLLHETSRLLQEAAEEEEGEERKKRKRCNISVVLLQINGDVFVKVSRKISRRKL